jgi:hypothetical protein
MQGAGEDRSDAHLEVRERGPQTATRQRARINGTGKGKGPGFAPGPLYLSFVG